jgi:hypothetical protein
MSSFECVVCSITFGYKDNLKRHMKKKHPESINPSEIQNSYTYPICSKPNTLNGNLKCHIKKIHLKKKNSSKRKILNQYVAKIIYSIQMF